MLQEEEYDDVWPARPANSTRRYQGLADVRSEMGRTADVQVQQSRRGNSRSPYERHTIPPRRAATQTHIPALPATRTPRAPIDEEGTLITAAYAPRKHSGLAGGQRRFHWLVFVGLSLMVMLFGWLLLSALGNWWQTTQNDWRYGRPRTFQTDQIVGQHDSAQHPSHFIAMNLNRHIVVIEIPGGDVSKSIIFNGPTLVGPGADLDPVTLTFEDVNHDGKVDMLINVQGSQFVFLNENGTFVASNQNPGN
jgi:hypothetical protein